MNTFSHQLRSGFKTDSGATAASARRGTALFAVLAALAVVSLIAVGLMRMALVEHQQLRVQQRSVQADRMAQAALQRAAAALRADRDYQGETWRVSGEEMNGRQPASAVIRVESVADRPAARRIIAQADYPAESTHRARKTSELVIELSPPERGDS